MKFLTATLGLLFIANAALGQLNTVGNNKPLGFLNPALQNTAYSKVAISASYIINPLAEEEQPPAYLALGEYKISENIRVGVKSLSVEDRLFSETKTGVYSSFRLPLEEKGSYFLLGVSLDAYNHTAKLQEFNKVFTPNEFYYDDRNSVEGTASGIDLGFGMAYESNGLTVGVGLNRVNRPETFLYPLGVIDTGVGSNVTVLDTSLIIGKGNFSLENNINVVYRWQVTKNIHITHSLHLSNLRFGVVDFIGFQNIAEIKNKHSLGFGAFYNGSPGFIATAGFGISEHLRIEGTAFIVEDLNYDLDLEDYVSSGIAPIIEGSLQIRF